MKIGIDIRAACGKKAGKGWYTYNLVKELVAQDKKNTYLLYTDTLTPDAVAFCSAGNATIKVIAAKGLWWHFAVIKEWKKEVAYARAQTGADDANSHDAVFFAPTSLIIPAFLPAHFRTVLTVHDLVAFLHPHLHQTKATILEQLFFRRALKKARRVLVPSENTKKDLIHLFHYSDPKITVTPLAAGEEFFAATDEVRMHEVRKKYNLPKEFVLTVSGLEPRKNVSRLVDAMVMLSKNHPHLTLVIVGGKGWKSTDTQKKIAAETRIKIIHINPCPPHDLPYLYKNAMVFAYPSLYEGFGLPPIEAMASGTPVMCSNKSSLPEVCGDAALLVDPKNTPALADALETLLNNKQLRESLSAKGRARAQQFSWKSTAQKTLHAFISL